MRGGAQAHLMRCSDGAYYVVKFQNNPQHLRILVNELLATRLAARLGLPTPKVAVVEVSRELIEKTPEMVVQLGAGREPCRPGFQFGSRFPGRPQESLVFDFLPDEQLREVDNVHEFAGMLVFDKWTCNTNGRQAIFYREAGAASYKAMMIDQGFCFNAGEWSFPDAPLRGLYSRQRVYEGVRGMEAFEPWLSRLNGIRDHELDEFAKEIPPDWYEDDQDALFQLLEQLQRRRRRVPELIEDARKSYRQPFPNWT